MRLLLLSDIHGNLEALEACLDAAPEYDHVANLGDVVGYGASPNQTVELIRAMEPLSVRGNHDRCCSGLENTENFNPVAAEAANWTRSELSERNLDWLRELPKGPIGRKSWTGVQFVHGSPADEDIYIHSDFSVKAAFAASSTFLTFFGHTHVQCAFAQPSLVSGPLPLERLNNASSAQVSRLKLNPALQYLVNPGSVGQPRDRDRRAAFALYESKKNEVLFYRVPYDIAGAQQRILRAGLPRVLALRLMEGM